EHCQRVRAAIESRYAELHRQGLLVCGMTVQDKPSGSPIEALAADDGASALRSAR
ncbi:carboxysome shell protein, partial [Acidithiobacillus ferrivorans]|nr:carboxysome shell protein [Acidithiobacillus ferrivorans]